MPEVIIINKKGDLHITLFSELDSDLIESYKWRVNDHNYLIRARRRKEQGNSTWIRFHRVIAERMHLDLSYEIDHINGNRLDNRRENLRIATRQQQLFNTCLRRNSQIPYKGVYFDKSRNKYMARIQIGGKQINLGRYDTPELAYQVYCLKASELFGEYFRAN